MSILKNLWNRRRANAWLFIELVIITILCWVMADRVAVSIADTSLPQGYDVDRLVIAEIRLLPAEADGHDAVYDSVDAANAAMAAIMAKVRAFEGVEYATRTDTYNMLGGQSCNITSVETGNLAVDTLVKPVYQASYFPDEQYFETYGIEAIPGSPSAEELSKILIDDSNTIITADLAELLWPGENPVGKQIVRSLRPDTVWQTVAGVVNGLRWTTMLRSNCLQFCRPYIDPDAPCESFSAVMRLRPGVDVGQFCSDFRAFARTGLSVGNYYAGSVIPYSEYLRQTEDCYGIHAERSLMFSLSAFFLLNLVLGTVGCFWLQTRKRVHEIGIRRAFGARRGHIVGMIVAESCVLATVAVAAGCLLYLQWAWHNGLHGGFGNNAGVNVMHTWVTDFGAHFAIVSAIVYVVILVCVVLGTLLPAIHASRIQVTDALHNE